MFTLMFQVLITLLFLYKMVRILWMASSIRPCISFSFRFSGAAPFRVASPQPLSLHTFRSVVPQSKLFSLNSSNLLRADEKSMVVNTMGNAAQSSTSAIQENVPQWVKQDKRRMLHVVYRVGDMDRTIKFYTECLGMKLLRRRDIPEERYTNAFLGYGPEDSHFVVELTYNYGVDKYDIGSGFGHFGIAVDDVAKTVEIVKAKGGKVTREPGPVKGGKTVIAFIEDPDGYKFELLERGPTPEPLCQVMLRVGDLDRAINFYEKAFGMELLRKYDNSEYKASTCTCGHFARDYKTPKPVSNVLRVTGPPPPNHPRARTFNITMRDAVRNTDVVAGTLPINSYAIAILGYGPEDKNAVLELTYNYGVTEYDKGNAYAQIAIGTNDIYKTAEAIRLCGGKITREPGPLPGISTKITACLDPDGWKSVFVDNLDFLKELEE